MWENTETKWSLERKRCQFETLFSRTYVRVRVLKRPRKLSHVIEENAGGQLNNMGLKVNSMEKVLGIQSQGLYFQRHFVIKLKEIWTFLTMFLFPETFSP